MSLTVTCKKSTDTQRGSHLKRKADRDRAETHRHAGQD